MNTTTKPFRSRVRLESAERNVARDGHDTVVVALEWDDVHHKGEAVGVHTRQGELRTSAHATLKAMRSVLGENGPSLGLIGIKAVRAFDGWVVIVSIELQEDPASTRLRLLGACTSEQGDLIHSAAVATLDALNRVLERYI